MIELRKKARRLIVGGLIRHEGATELPNQASPQTMLPRTPGNGGRRQNAGCAVFLLGAAVILLLLL